MALILLLLLSMMGYSDETSSSSGGGNAYITSSIAGTSGNTANIKATPAGSDVFMSLLSVMIRW